jgi:large subunit ribosomal protein L21
MTKYAIIETGGKQYKVQVGDELDVELLKVENVLQEGSFTFDKVLLVNDGSDSTLGLPYVANCKVLVEIQSISKGPKVIAFKYKRCKGYRRLLGHRQKYSRVLIKEIAVA